MFLAEVDSIAGKQLTSAAPSCIPQEITPNPSCSYYLPSKLIENLATRIEELPFIEKQSPFITYAKIVQEKKSTSGVSKIANKALLKNKPVDTYNFGPKVRHITCPQTSDSTFMSLERVNNMEYMNEKQHFFQTEYNVVAQFKTGQIPTYRTCDVLDIGSQSSCQNASIEDNLVKNIISCKQNEYKYSKNEILTPIELEFLHKIFEYLFSSRNDVLLNGKRDISAHISNKLLPDKHEKDYENKSSRNAKAIFNVQNLYLTCNPPIHEILLEYRQIYSKTRPEHFDFAMHMMAFIEYLNDETWVATYSYFPHNVQRLVKHFWKGLKYFVHRKFESNKIGPRTFHVLMNNFSDLCEEENFNLYQYLNYSVLLCQLAVIAKRGDFKEAPLRVIMFLRYILQNVRGLYPLYMFDSVVETYANKIVKTWCT